jgi:hypothetical protein
MARKKEPDSAHDDADHEAHTDAETVEVVVDHVYLPVGEDGNVPAVWREVPTVRVGRGTKLAMPADLIEVLGDKVARVA